MADRDFFLTLVVDGLERDVHVGSDTHATGEDLLRALTQYGGQPSTVFVERIHKSLQPEEPLASTGLLSGDRLTFGAGRSGPRVEIRKSRTLDFVTGPEAGRWVALGAGGGEIPVGKGNPGGFSISVNSGIEAKHFTISVDNDLNATIRAVGAPLFVNEQIVQIGQSIKVSDDDLIRAGDHGLAVRSYERQQTSFDRLMQVKFRPTPYRPTIVRDSSIEAIRRIPQASSSARLQFIAMLLPLVAGLSLLAATLLSGNSSGGSNLARLIPSLVFVAMSPLLMWGSWFSNKRQGKKTFVEEVSEFRELLVDRVQQMASACQQERLLRWRASPDIPLLSRRAIFQLPELWQRHRQAEDLLVLRLGEFDTSARVSYAIPDQGDGDLVDEAHDVIGRYRAMNDVPYTVDLKSLGVIALIGEPQAVKPVAASLLVQVTTLHSPEDVVVAVLAPGASRISDGELDIARASRFIPHSRSLSSPISGKHTATKKGIESEDLLGTLLGVAYDRIQRKANTNTAVWPWIVVFVDEQLAPNPLLLSQLGEICSAASMSLIVSAGSPSDVTRRARLTFSVSSDYSVATPMDPLEPVALVRPTSITPTTFWSTVRALAPLRDVTESKAVAAIPRIADLFQTLGGAGDVRELISANWSRVAKFNLQHPIGIGQNGPFNIDLVADGPHMLIGGTSGAGKSELLMSMIASLAVHHPPERVNFLFFDYKGGAGTQMFEALPHTVGSVTNLDGDLALRALTSLRAEIEYRMRLITDEHNCKDIKEMWEKHPSKAPPALVLVFDEFATLVKEVPEFITGVVDVAQRGRSLGVHLILATQRPSGAINENIQANTNIRIALRMVDAAESASVLGAPEAAEIPVPLRGRGFVRLGPKQILPFQSAYTGAPSAGVARPPVEVRELGSEEVSVSNDLTGVETQGERVVQEIVSLWAELGRPAPRRPWRPDLPEVLPRNEVATDASATTDFVVGLLDDPKRQAQPTAIWDARTTTSIMVFGSAKSGKTTLLRNIGRIASDQARRHEWNVVTVDFGTRGLDVLRQFPNTVLSANADSLESITRTIRYLELEVARRRGLLAAHACASYEQLIARVPNLPRLLVLVDDFQNFGGAFGGAVLGSQAPEFELGRFIATLSDAGSCGVHYVVGADRRSSIRASMHSAIPARIVLRQGDEMGYFDFGISIARGSIPKLPAGRGFWLDDKRVQFVSDAGDEQETTDRTASDRAIAVATALPEHIVLEAGQEFPRVVVGVCDVTHELCRHDVSRRPLLVIGPRGSGRSHALRWWVSQANPKHVKHVQSTADLAKVSRGDVIVIDDADVAVNQIEDSAIFAAIREKECHLMFSINARNSNGLGFGWLRDFARDAACLVLQPDDRHSQTALSTFFDRLPYLRPGLEYPAGRGTFSAGRTSVVVQVPQLGEDK